MLEIREKPLTKEKLSITYERAVWEAMTKEEVIERERLGIPIPVKPRKRNYDPKNIISVNIIRVGERYNATVKFPITMNFGIKKVRERIKELHNRGYGLEMVNSE